MYKSVQSLPLWIYLLVLVPCNLLGHILGDSVLLQLSKPLLLPVLIICFLSGTSGYKSKIKIPVVLALFFSWVGDVALMYDSQYPILFVIGLGGFLIAHIHYAFVFVKSSNKISSLSKMEWMVLPVMFLYTAGLITVLWTGLGELKIPVFVYAMVLLSMGVTALIRNQKTGYTWVLTGALLFIASDSVLAFNKFYTTVSFSGVLIMLTYTMAQLFIVLGLSKLIISNK